MFQKAVALAKETVRFLSAFDDCVMADVVGEMVVFVGALMHQRHSGWQCRWCRDPDFDIVFIVMTRTSALCGCWWHVH